MKEILKQIFRRNKIDYNKPPLKLSEKYHLSDPVTRDNVTAFLISSFVYSRGSVPLQKTFLEWMKIRYKIPYEIFIKDLKQSGGVHSLPEDEQRLFLDSYIKYKKYHLRADFRYNDEGHILDFIDSFLDHMLSYKSYLTTDQLNKITTIQEFIQKTEAFFD